MAELCRKQALEPVVLFGGRGTWGHEGLLGIEPFSSPFTLFPGTIEMVRVKADD